MPSISAPSSAAPPPPPPSQPAAPPVQQEQKKDEGQIVSDKPKVSAAPVQDLPVVSKEERIEYRDEHGNLLDEAAVKALEGKVSFKTRYETRTRVIDAQGNEVYDALVDQHEVDGPGVAPPHPDVEGRNPETGDLKEAEASEAPPTVAVEEDEVKEKSVEEKKDTPRPASEAQEATQQR